MRRFCYECGTLEAERGPLIHGLCQNCFAAKHKLLSVPTELELKICKRCHACFVSGIWKEPAGEFDIAMGTFAKDLARSKLRIAQFVGEEEHFLSPDQVKGLELVMEPRVREDRVSIEIHARGKVHMLQREPHDERVSVGVGLNWNICDTCNLRISRYYEAILQVRNTKKLSKEKLDEIVRLIQSCVAKEHEKDRRAYIAKVDEKLGGPDYYVNPTSLARQIAGALKSRFKAKLAETSKLVGVDKSGRKKFRVTVLVRLPEAIK